MWNGKSDSQLFIPFARHEGAYTANDYQDSHLRNINYATLLDSNRVKRRRCDIQYNGQIQRSVPWKKRDHYSPNVVGLHEEINDFYDTMSPVPEEKEVRLRVVNHVQQIVKSLWSQAKVNVFGSFNTGLYLPTSDIDIVVTGKWDNLPFNTLKTALIKNGIDDGDISMLPHAAVPIVRFVHTPTKVKVDISFNVANGIKSAELIKNSMKMFPALPKIVLVLKQFLLHRGLNEVYHGGMSSYALTLLVISFLQGHHKPKSLPATNLGTLLLEFFELYGINFNYEKVLINVRNGGFYCPKPNLWSSYLSIEDPLCEGNDIAKGTYMMREIKSSFENAYNTLHKALTETEDGLRPESILQLILNVDSNVFIQRQWIIDHFHEILKYFTSDHKRDSKSRDWKENVAESFLPSMGIKGSEIDLEEKYVVQNNTAGKEQISKDTNRPQFHKTRIFYGSRHSVKNTGVDKSVSSMIHQNHIQHVVKSCSSNEYTKKNYKHSKRHFKQMTNNHERKFQ